jgi:cobalt-zinc-cadmium efflux system outer membrane protein
VIGYQVMQLADEGTDQHTAFIDQEFVTADKLAMNRQVLQQSVRAQQWEFESQRLRIQTDLRRAFSKALAAQKRLELISEFEVVAAKGVELAELRRAASEGSQVDVLQARIQLQEVQLSKNQTNIALSSSWRELAAISGVETLQTSTLLGTLAEEPVEISWSDYTQQLLAGSPEYQVAQTQLQESLAVLQRQEVQAIPNWQVQLAAGKDNGTDSGMMNLQVGIPIPLHHANRGLIAAARADYCHAQQELQRVQQSIAARVARVSEEYDAARLAVLRYRNEIVPNALQTLELAEAAYTAGESSFLEVLIVRKTYFDSNLQRLNAEEQFAVAKASIDGSLLTGALDASIDRSRDTSLRDATFNQQ